MRKSKVYIGRNKNVNQFGQTTHLPKSQWAVPRMLRKYFSLQLSRHFQLRQLKMRMNSVVGATGTTTDSQRFGELLEERRQLKRKFLSGNF